MKPATRFGPEDGWTSSFSDFLRRGIGTALATLFILVLTAVGRAQTEPVRGHCTNTIEGWMVLVDLRLLEIDSAETDNALELLGVQLKEIVQKVPPQAVTELRKVTLWFSPEYPGVQPRAEYHPGAAWLRDNGRNPAMVHGVEFTNIRIFESETTRMPNFALHELAHAYHDRVLSSGFANAEIKTAFERAKSSGTYDRVLRRDAAGKTRFDKAYAMTNPQEYFAETTEAFFSTNDFFPFNRAELEQHDPEMARLLGRLWGAKP